MIVNKTMCSLEVVIPPRGLKRGLLWHFKGVNKMHKNNGKGLIMAKINCLLGMLWAWDVTTPSDPPSYEFGIRSSCQVTFSRWAFSELLWSPILFTFPPFGHKAVWRMHRWASPLVGQYGLTVLGRLIPWKSQYQHHPVENGGPLGIRRYYHEMWVCYRTDPGWRGWGGWYTITEWTHPCAPGVSSPPY